MTPPEAAPMREEVDIAFAREVVEQIKEFAPALSHTTDARHHLDRAQLAIWGLLRARTARPGAGDEIEALAALIPSNIGPIHPGSFADDIVVPVDMTAGEIRRARAALAAMREGVDRGMVERIDDADLAGAVAKLLPIGNDQLPGDRVVPIYVRMDELRALHALTALSRKGEAKP